MFISTVLEHKAHKLSHLSPKGLNVFNLSHWTVVLRVCFFLNYKTSWRLISKVVESMVVLKCYKLLQFVPQDMHPMRVVLWMVMVWLFRIPSQARGIWGMWVNDCGGLTKNDCTVESQYTGLQYCVHDDNDKRRRQPREWNHITYPIARLYWRTMGCPLLARWRKKAYYREYL